MFQLYDTRFFGPLPRDEAQDVVDQMMEDKNTVDILIRFLDGTIEVSQMSAEIQIVAESTWVRTWGPNVEKEGLDGV